MIASTLDCEFIPGEFRVERLGVADRSWFSVQAGRPLVRGAPEAREVLLSEPAPARAAFVEGGSGPDRASTEREPLDTGDRGAGRGRPGPTGAGSALAGPPLTPAPTRGEAGRQPARTGHAIPAGGPGRLPSDPTQPGPAPAVRPSQGSGKATGQTTEAIPTPTTDSMRADPADIGPEATPEGASVSSDRSTQRD